MYVGPEGAGGTRVTTVVEFTPLRSASHLDSKISVGKSPKLGTRQGWFVGSHGVLREVEKTPLKLHWHASQLFFKVPHRELPSCHDHWPTPTAGQDFNIASRIFEIQRRFWDRSAGSVSVCWPEVSWSTQRKPCYLNLDH